MRHALLIAAFVCCAAPTIAQEPTPADTQDATPAATATAQVCEQCCPAKHSVLKRIAQAVLPCHRCCQPVVCCEPPKPEPCCESDPSDPCCRPRLLHRIRARIQARRCCVPEPKCGCE